MSWNSLFSFSNPNGDVGRQFTGTSTIIAGVTQLVPNSNNKAVLATFNYLPMGVYNISTQVDINWTQGITINYCEIGLSQSIDNPVALFPATSLLINLIANATSAINSSLNANFIISVTNANPYYIYIDTTIGAGGTPVFTTTTTCIATKLA